MTIEVEKTSAFNTAIAAGISERVIDKPTIGYFWNKLLVTNRDVVAVQVQLDGRTDSGYIFELKAGDGMLIDEKDGIQFRSVDQKNLDAAAETANKVLFRASRAI